MPVASVSLKLVRDAPNKEDEERKPSLKEQPSYLKEVGVALSRREELLKLKERLSSSRLILSADPSSKPWLLARQISQSKIVEAKPAAQPRRKLRERSGSSSSEEK